MATLGEGCPEQRYDDRELKRIARAARREAAAREAGKAYCPCCHLREARWRRHEGSATLFVYCTQCHKTGLATILEPWWARVLAAWRRRS